MKVNYHRNTSQKITYICKILRDCGIEADLQTGKIHYLCGQPRQLLCRSFNFIRHADTIGTVEHRFMSDYSSNSVIVNKGIIHLKSTAEKINILSPDAILYSDIPRVKQTSMVIKEYIKGSVPFIELTWMRGIDNAGWENCRPDELEGIDKQDYIQRELKHNIFAKSKYGSSWGEVLVCAAKLIEYINTKYKDKDIVIISQGSLYYALKLILRIEMEPWNDYNTETFYNLKSTDTSMYGKLQRGFIPIRKSKDI